jgi:hypothetical protein
LLEEKNVTMAGHEHPREKVILKVMPEKFLITNVTSYIE